MREFDFSPLYRSTIGFDRLANLFDAANELDRSGTSYPPYNIERLDENDYRITMAVAGFAQDEIQIESKENRLTISGQKVTDSKEKTFLHQGIATRSFERRFELADHVVVTGASLENGLLHVELVREIPEEKKPRRIEISTSGKQKALPNEAAAA